MDNDELRLIADPLERANRARALMEERNQANSVTAGIFRDAVAEMCATRPKAEVAVLLGVTKGRVSQLTKATS